MVGKINVTVYIPIDRDPKEEKEWIETIVASVLDALKRSDEVGNYMRVRTERNKLKLQGKMFTTVDEAHTFLSEFVNLTLIQQPRVNIIRVDIRNMVASLRGFDPDIDKDIDELLKQVDAEQSVEGLMFMHFATKMMVDQIHLRAAKVFDNTLEGVMKELLDCDGDCEHCDKEHSKLHQDRR